MLLQWNLRRAALWPSIITEEEEKEEEGVRCMKTPFAIELPCGLVIVNFAMQNMN